MQPIYEAEDENFTSQAEIDIGDVKGKIKKKSSSIGAQSNSLNHRNSLEKQFSEGINGSSQ
jgi:hypothetical protein